MVQTPATLDATLRRMASEQPQRILLTDARDPDAPMDYRWGETDQLVNGLARQLAQQPGDAVGVLLDNSYRCICLIYAVMRAGKDLVLIDPEWGQAAKRAIIDEMSLRVLAGNITLHDEFAGLQAPLDFAPLPAGEQAPDRAAQSRMILFTSGTTGKRRALCSASRRWSALMPSANAVCRSASTPAPAAFTGSAGWGSSALIFCSRCCMAAASSCCRCTVGLKATTFGVYVDRFRHYVFVYGAADRQFYGERGHAAAASLPA
ncbi:Plipastatin synthase subunit D [Serratia rubidaea]|uniref:Plipastatin synthase subunit D n=1 Tax=Serratia rubidaea TaxID=61652 RepID=A0A4U9HD04_SERRU|nr:Plipastatin synthase subunit D [Serratia rubidaea]